MNILIFNSYYPPEIASSMYLEEDIAIGFAEAGHNVTMLVPSPTRGLSDDEIAKFSKEKEVFLCDGRLHIIRYKSTKEKRNPLFRLCRYLSQNIKQFFYGIKMENVDAIFCGSTPPTQGWIVGRVKKKLEKKLKKKIPFIYNLNDIFPDSMVNAGMIRKESLIWKLGRRIESETYKSADKIIVISNDFKRNLIEKGVDCNKIRVIYNWIDLEKVVPISRENNKLFDELRLNKDYFTVVYAGNFGTAQNVKIILDAAKIINNDNIQFLLFGAGSEFESVKQYKNQLGLKNVRIEQLLPSSRVSEVYSLGDINLITCKSGFGNCGFPSKTWSILACNSKILASFDEESELSQLITNNSLGIVVNPDNSELLANAILDSYSNRNNVFVDGRSFVKNNASKKVCVSKYVEEVEGCL